MEDDLYGCIFDFAVSARVLLGMSEEEAEIEVREGMEAERLRQENQHAL